MSDLQCTTRVVVMTTRDSSTTMELREGAEEAFVSMVREAGAAQVVVREAGAPLPYYWSTNFSLIFDTVFKFCWWFISPQWSVTKAAQGQPVALH